MANKKNDNKGIDPGNIVEEVKSGFEEAKDVLGKTAEKAGELFGNLKENIEDLTTEAETKTKPATKKAAPKKKSTSSKSSGSKSSTSKSSGTKSTSKSSTNKKKS